MKSLPTLLVIATVGCAFAAPAPIPSFSEQKIGLPSLFLQDAIVANDSALEPRSRGPGTLSPPRTFLERAALTASPKPEEKSGPRIRVIAPDPTIDYKMRIVVPSADIDPKMIVDGGREAADATK